MVEERSKPVTAGNNSGRNYTGGNKDRKGEEKGHGQERNEREGTRTGRTKSREGQERVKTKELGEARLEWQGHGQEETKGRARDGE